MDVSTMMNYCPVCPYSDPCSIKVKFKDTLISHNVKSTDRWSNGNWSSCYKAMCCWETLGHGIHVDVPWHLRQVQLLMASALPNSVSRQCALPDHKICSGMARGKWRWASKTVPDTFIRTHILRGMMALGRSTPVCQIWATSRPHRSRMSV